MKNIKIDKKFILISGIALRILYFAVNLIVGGHHCDEAMTSLNAASLADNLTDITGERLPLYFDTWLTGGQSPMATYLSAISVKLFGLNLFGIRFPIMIASILGFCAFVGFAEELFGKTKQARVIEALGCISPWMIFSGVFVLDCDYLAYFVIIALYFLAKALNNRKSIFYILSMLFFSASLRCYMSAVLLIPVMLVVMYGVLILKKKISAKEVLISVVSMLIFSLPFILFGLVNVGAINEFSVLGIDFAKMPYYARSRSVAFGSGFADAFSNGFINLIVAALFIIGVDITATGVGMNIFQYGNLFAGIFLAIGIIQLVFALFKNKKAFTFYQKAFCLSMFCGMFFYCFSVNNVKLAFMFRLGVLTPMFLIFEGIGLCTVLSSIKRFDLKKALAAYLILSFLIFNAEFFGIYINQTKTTFDIIYGDSFYSCLDTADEHQKKNIVIYDESALHQSRISIYCRYHYYNSDIEFVNLQDELIKRDLNGEPFSQPTVNSEIVFVSESEIENNTADCYIAATDIVNGLSLPEGYTAENNGYWSIVYKTE